MKTTTIRVWLGTWTLDRAQSTFSGVAPDKRSMKFEIVQTGIRHVTETVTSVQVFSRQQ